MSHPSDEELMRLVRERHRPALELLYDRYAKLVYSSARKFAQDEASARDIVQAVFMRLWTTQAEFRSSQGEFVNWVLTITRNAAMDQIRKARKQEQAVSRSESEARLDSRGGSDSPEHSPEAAADRRFLRQKLLEASESLSQSQAQLIHLVYWQGYTLREAAERCGEPLGTIKNRLHQALKILRLHLSATQEEVWR